MKIKHTVVSLIGGGLSGLIGEEFFRILFRQRKALHWPNPTIASLSAWWLHLAVWSAFLFVGTLIIFLALFRKHVDLRGTISTIGLLAASWTMFLVSQVSSDVMTLPQSGGTSFSKINTAFSTINIAIWLATFIVLFMTVDDVRARKIRWKLNQGDTRDSCPK